MPRTIRWNAPIPLAIGLPFMLEQQSKRTTTSTRGVIISTSLLLSRIQAPLTATFACHQAKRTNRNGFEEDNAAGRTGRRLWAALMIARSYLRGLKIKLERIQNPDIYLTRTWSPNQAYWRLRVGLDMRRENKSRYVINRIIKHMQSCTTLPGSQRSSARWCLQRT